MKCKICGHTLKSNKSYPGHLTAKHCMTTKDYYDLYLRQPNEGICLNCGKPTRFVNISKGYKDYCSLKCATPHIQEQHLKTIQSKYGVNNIAKIPTAKDKIKQTMLNKYGVEYFCITEKCLNAGHTKEAMQKGNKVRQQTCLKKYGVKNALCLPEVQAKAHSKVAIQKAHNTRKLNGWCTSKLENYVSQFLEEHTINFKHNFKSTNYPWKVDFYLDDYDLYIEINRYWMHGGHWYNKDNLNDNNLLYNWQSKNESSIFQDAIKTWTISDLRKRDHAIENNLNYVVLWNKEQVNQFLVDLESGKQFIGFIDYNCLQET